MSRLPRLVKFKTTDNDIVIAVEETVLVSAPLSEEKITKVIVFNTRLAFQGIQYLSAQP